MTRPTPPTVMTHAALIEVLRDCEQSEAGQVLLADPEVAAAYPLARQRVVAVNLAGITTSGLPARRRALRARLAALMRIARHEGPQLFSGPPRAKGGSALAFLSYSTSRLFPLPQGWPDAYADAFLSDVEAQGHQATLFEIPAMGEYRTPRLRPGYLLGRDELYTRLMARLNPAPPQAATGIADFVAMWDRAGLSTDGLSPAGWARLWAHFTRRRALFKRQLVRVSPEIAIAVTWYGTTGMAFCAAAHDLGIPAADLQHGVQGSGHCMYSHWPQQTLASPLIPRAFMNWGAAEAAHLETWIDPARRTYVCGLPWMHMDQALLATSPDYQAFQAAIADRPVVLVSLQPDAGDLLDLVETGLRHPQASRYAWALRCHPGHVDQIPHLEARFAHHPNVLPVSPATFAPLGLVLGASTAHLTAFSSVVLEAAAAGVPSFLSSNYGRALYPHLGAGILDVTPDAEALVAGLARVSAQDNTDTGPAGTPQTALAAFRDHARAGIFFPSSSKGSVS